MSSDAQFLPFVNFFSCKVRKFWLSGGEMHLLTFRDETRAPCQDVAAMRQIFVSGSGTKVVGRTT